MRQWLLIVLLVFSLGCSRIGQAVEGGSASMLGGHPAPPTSEHVLTEDENVSCNVPDGWWSTVRLTDKVWDYAVFGPGEDSILVMGPDDKISEISLESLYDMRQFLGRSFGYGFRLSPDGKYLSGGISGSEPHQAELVLLNLATGEEELTGVYFNGVLAWVDSGESLVIMVEEPNNRMWLRKVNLSSGATEDLVLATDASPDGEWPYGDPVMEVKSRVITQRLHMQGSLSPDGQQLLFAAGQHLKRVFRLDMRTGALFTYPKTETDGRFVHWAPDGRHAYYGFPGIHVLDTVTGEVEQYKPFPLLDYITDVASDGRILARSGHCWVVGMLDRPPSF